MFVHKPSLSPSQDKRRPDPGWCAPIKPSIECVIRLRLGPLLMSNKVAVTIFKTSFKVIKIALTIAEKGLAYVTLL